MLKQYIITSLLAVIGYSSYKANAQQTTALSADTISILRISKVPGRLFSMAQNVSTGSVSTVNGETLYKMPTPNLTNTLYGRLPGLTVLQNLGEPGADDASLGIRGSGSYGYGSFGAFKIFVDGFEVNYNYFRNLSTSEIHTVSVLKDAAALSTFGMRGANGIIWVETKRGNIGKPVVQFKARSGVQSPIKLPSPLNSYEFATLYNQAISNDRGGIYSPVYTDAQLQAYQNGTGTNVNWFNEVLKDRAPYSDADLTFSGGDASARYNVVMDYANQKGLYNVPDNDTSSNEQFKRYNLRTNLDFKMFNIFEAQVDLNARIEERRMPNLFSSPGFASVDFNRFSMPSTSSTGSNSIWSILGRYPSNVYSVRDPSTGQWSGTTVYPDNPVATVSDRGWGSFKNRYLQGNFQLKENLDGIVKGLYARQGFSFNSFSLATQFKTSNYARYFNGTKTTNDNTTPIALSGLGAQQQEDIKQAFLSLGFDRQIGEHQLKTAINYHQHDYKGEGVFATFYRYQNVSGKAHYSFQDKYVGEFGFSYFGSDAYAPGNRWGFYPALSAAWIISKEAFLSDNRTINYLKLRASAGKTGYADSDEGSLLSGLNGRYLYQQYYSSSAAFYTGDGTVGVNNGLNPVYIANPDIFAEQSLKYNVGLELTLIKKLDFSFDIFLDKRSGIITRDNSIPAYFGNNTYTSNLGKQTNAGFEASTTYKDKFGKLGLQISGMAFYNKNKIDLMGEVAPAFAYNAITGRSVGTPIGLVSEGFYDIGDFNADGSLKSGQAVPAFGPIQAGDLKYRDLDKNGIVDNNDRTEIGKPYYPRLTYAMDVNLNYAGFDLSLLLQGISGSSMNILGNNTTAFVNNGNAFPIAKGAWAYYPSLNIDTRASATYPRLTTLANENNYRLSSFWIKDRSFLRVRNIEFGYSVSDRLLNRTGLDKLRVYINVMNPITWSALLKDYEIDPETPQGYSNYYPGLKSINAGISLNF
jgi:TonB-linked SusC/RagA family outer membrane protein